MSHKLLPYGLSDREWRALLLYLVNKDNKNYLWTVFLRILPNGQEISLRPQTGVLTSNVRTEDLPLPPQKERKRSKWTEIILSRNRERELKTTLGVDSQRFSSAT